MPWPGRTDPAPRGAAAAAGSAPAAASAGLSARTCSPGVGRSGRHGLPLPGCACSAGYRGGAVSETLRKTAGTRGGLQRVSAQQGTLLFGFKPSWARVVAVRLKDARGSVCVSNPVFHRSGE